MAEGNDPTQDTGQQDLTQGTEGATPDYKALYEEAKRHARDWEKKAKANKGAATALDEANAAKQTAEQQIAELTRRLDEKESAERRAKIAAKVAQEKGVPAELLVGDDEEGMAAWADKMLSAFKKKPAASVEKPGSFDTGTGGDKGELRDYVKQLLK